MIISKQPIVPYLYKNYDDPLIYSVGIATYVADILVKFRKKHSKDNFKSIFVKANPFYALPVKALL
jgi:hypothetical protein